MNARSVSPTLASLATLLLLLLSSHPLSAQTPDSTLSIAARDGDVATVERLIAADADLNAYHDGLTPLMFAAMNGELEIARLLIDAGADLNRTSDDYGPALGVAAMAFIEPEEGPTALVELLIEKGASLELGNGSRMTPLMFAAREGKADVVRTLLDHGANASHQDGRGWSPLMFAVRSGNAEVVRMMLEAEADPNVTGDYPFRRPIHDAMEGESLEILELLLTNGAEPGGGGYGPELKAPIVKAAAANRTAFVATLLGHGANPNVTDFGFIVDEVEEPRTPLDWAIAHGNEEMEEMLRDNFAITQKEMEAGQDAMLAAIRAADHDAFMEALAMRADPGLYVTRGEEEFYLLSEAAMVGSADIVQAILENTEMLNQYSVADAYVAADTSGHEDVVRLLEELRTVDIAYHAIAEGDDELIERLLAANGWLVEAWEENDRSLLHLAVDEGLFRIVTLMLDAGADTEMEDSWGETPLFSAVRNGDLDMAVMLLDHGASVVHPNRFGMTPLTAAARVVDGSVDMMRLLIERGADVNAATMEGSTSLHQAAWAGSVEGITLLLESGARTDAVDSDGRTPADVAEIMEQWEAAELLRSGGR